MNLRIAILRSDDAHHGYLADCLQDRFDVVAHVVEPARAQRARTRRSARWSDYGYTLYHHARRSLLGLDAFRAGYFADRPTPSRPAPAPLVVSWINEPAVGALLREAQPDLTVIICTSILRDEVLQATSGPIINVHGGCLPRYRGNHCFFFALYNRDFENIGSTIHFVDRGIDTGAIIEVVRPELRPDDTAETLYCRAEKGAIHRLVELLDDLQRGRPLPRYEQKSRSRLHRTRDRKLHHDLSLWLRRRLGMFEIPARPAPSAARPGASPAVIGRAVPHDARAI